MMKLLALLLFVPAIVLAQKTKDNIAKKLGPNPLTVLDSVMMPDSVFFKTNPKDIAVLTILTDTDATKLYGDTAKDGVVIAQTKQFARKHYVAFFRKKSIQYDSLCNITKSDSTFQYIINDKVKTGNFEGDLALIGDDNLFISLSILSADDLKKRYNITNKDYGILIYAKKPDNLRNKDKKF